MSAQDAIPRFPFVVGCDRSGTTLLRAMLASHPQVSIPDESFFIVSLARHRRRYERRSSFDAERFLHELSYDPNYRRWAIRHEEVVGAFRDAPPASYAEAIRAVYAVYARVRGRTRYGDKTPVYVMHMQSLARLFPEAVFIHIVRDGRDVALSLVDRMFELPRDVGQAALFWRDRVRTGRRVGAALGGRYREIRYEDLLSDPAATLEVVCRHAQLPFDEAILAQMLSYPGQAAALLQDAADPTAHENVKRGLTLGLRNWREQMPERDRVLIEAIAGDTLRAAGYPVSPSAPTGRLAISARATSARVRWFARSRLLLLLFWCKGAVTRLQMNVSPDARSTAIADTRAASGVEPTRLSPVMSYLRKRIGFALMGRSLLGLRAQLCPSFGAGARLVTVYGVLVINAFSRRTRKPRPLTASSSSSADR